VVTDEKDRRRRAVLEYPATAGEVDALFDEVETVTA